MNRRELMIGAATTLGGMAIPKIDSSPAEMPKHDPSPAPECTVWMVVCGGHCQDAEGLAEINAVERKAQRLGWEALDRRHEVDRQSTVLVRMPMSNKAARLLEHRIMSGKWTELPVSAIWVEVPG